VPGTYSVSMARKYGTEITPLGEPQTFTTTPLRVGSLPADPAEIAAFQVETRALQRTLISTQRSLTEITATIGAMQRVAEQWPSVPHSAMQQIEEARTKAKKLGIRLNGDRLVSRHFEATPPSLSSRMNGIVFGHWGSTSNPTGTQRRAFEIVSDAIGGVVATLKELADTDLPAIEQILDEAGAPWTPGRLPTWP